MKLINNLFPQDATNYQGSKIAFYGFAIILVLTTWRSIIHMFFWKIGLIDIANFVILEGEPDPMVPIYLFFSLWGMEQILICLLAWIIFFKYQGLIPMMIFIFAFYFYNSMFFSTIKENNITWMHI